MDKKYQLYGTAPKASPSDKFQTYSKKEHKDATNKAKGLIRGKAKELIKKKIRLLEKEHAEIEEYLTAQFASLPKEHHDKLRKSFIYAKFKLAIKLWELKIEFWKSLIGE